MFSLAQAAKATGKSKPTITRAIKSGKLSATRRQDGSYAIDPSELVRVFPLTGDSRGAVKQSVPDNGIGTYPAPSGGEVEGLRLLLTEREETIRDLRARLDAAAEERQRDAEERRRLMALLTDQRSAPPASASPPPAPRRWWNWRRRSY